MAKQNLSILDERMAARNDVKTAIIFSMRNWQAHYMLPGNSHTQKSGEATFNDRHQISSRSQHETPQYLEKAYLGAMAAHRQNEPSAWLFSLAIFMAIESRHLDTATSMLDAAMGYRSFLKSNEPFYYNAFSFLKAYLATVENRARAAKKYRKAFLSQLKSAEYSPNYDVMIGQLHMAAAEHTQAYELFARAYGYGCRSMYLYEGLFRSLPAANPAEIGEELLPTLIHAAQNGANISRVTTIHEDAIFAAIMQNPPAGEKLYTLSSHAPLLKPICANRMYNNDFTLSAHKLYTQAIKHQIDLKELSTFVVYSSYANHIEKIDSYPLERFLKNASMEPQLAAYVYHLLLTDPALNYLMQGREDTALQAAAHCLENGITGREVNSLYQYYLTQCISTGTIGGPAQKAEAILQKNLTQFELTTTTETKYIYIALNEKRGTNEYAIPETTGTKGRIIIDAPNENFSYTCLGAGRRVVIAKPLTIKRMAPLANPELYQYFYDKGDRRFHVLAYLASHYLEADTNAAIQKKVTTLPLASDTSKNSGAISPGNKKAIPVFEAILEDKSLQKPYRMKILAALGNLYHQTNNHSKAQECYAQIDMQSLPPEYLQQALKACLQSNEHALAIEIIVQNHKTLPSQTVYEGLHLLLKSTPLQQSSQSTSTKPDNQLANHLSEAAYSLLLSGHHSETLLSTVLTHYQASQAELKALSQALETPDPRLDAKILSGDLWSHECDTHTQKAFRRLASAKQAQKECEQFIEYCIYVMLTQNQAPEYETINVLEKHYLSQADNKTPAQQDLNNLLLLALCQTYLHHNISTFRSDKLLKQALSMQEAMGTLLPIFKENKPITHPFLEKYQPFIFQSQPDKDIRLNYRTDETKDFKSTPMQYLAYGLYTAKLPLFYNETVTYYYSEEMPTGSITTHQATHKNTTPFIHDYTKDTFFAINNAIIHEHMFRHQEMEDIIDQLILSPVAVQAQLI